MEAANAVKTISRAMEMNQIEPAPKVKRSKTTPQVIKFVKVISLIRSLLNVVGRRK